ncbi:hypothetical protein NDR87_13620 [Nocardia sp. CDC159]|uniref:Uncharacterized protein n=1 Tax=Nocardia pulmonis TaxID=2951408 RepID=A0A9X2E582_9NOCA|nr:MULTISPECIES: hypothetical protein [Nocardia]MCM6774537.1 hypothetical protein [Nocardia pulmonis]MCM6787397.1 hypothetical protein [Nocardia sp. CDC159]
MFTAQQALLRAVTDYVDHCRRVLDFTTAVTGHLGGDIHATATDLAATTRQLENTLLIERAAVAAALDNPRTTSGAHAR